MKGYLPVPGCGRHRNQGRASGRRRRAAPAIASFSRKVPPERPHSVGPFCLCSSGNLSRSGHIGDSPGLPGPFDYEAGICLLQGLGKFDALYGVNLRHALACRMDIEPEAIRFANDASAFALGELGFGLAKAAPRAMFICIGTGCGSAFGVGGALAPFGTPGVPACGCLQRPFWRGVDDYLSRRGLEKLTQEYLGMPFDGKSLAHLAQEGNCQAQLCFWPLAGKSGTLYPVSCAISPGCSVLWRSNHTQRLVFPEAHGTCLPHAEYPALHHRRHLRPYTSGLNPI